MKTIHFPYLALLLAAGFLLVVTVGREAGADGATALPLLTLLVISEFSFFVTAAGAYIGLKQMLATGFKPVYAIASLCCALLSIRFMLLGLELWPQ
ncbi:MAG: hypothetical protein JKY87_07875 [Mariprofundus sp.]|nr:hypothetical protein [Mariprofundus sp.]